MRVLQVYRTYFPDPQGGLQEAIRQVACATAAFGVESRVFTLSPTPVPVELERPEARVVRSRSWAAPASCDLGGPDAFRRFAEQARWADVVHYHHPWPFADLLRLAAPAGKPSVMTYHSDVVRQRVLGALYRPLMRRTLAAMDAIVATSRDYLESSPVLSTLEGARMPRVIPLGIVEESYAGAVADSHGIDLPARFGAEPGTYFLAVGVLRYYKGLHTLVEAAARSGRRVLIAGSGPERERLARQIALSGAPVDLLGFVSEAEKIALIAGSIGLVLPSHLRSEAFGMVLVEAAMLGRPMISCALSTGTTFVNADGTTGVVVPPERPAELAAAMDTLALDRPRADAMGVAARERYERLFSGPALGSGYAELYRAVAAGAAARAGGVGILQ